MQIEFELLGNAVARTKTYIGSYLRKRENFLTNKKFLCSPVVSHHAGSLEPQQSLENKRILSLRHIILKITIRDCSTVEQNYKQIAP